VPTRLALCRFAFFEHDHAFEDVNVLIEAFEETLHALNLVGRVDWLTLAAINAE
jgi:hypothetical protein